MNGDNGANGTGAEGDSETTWVGQSLVPQSYQSPSLYDQHNLSMQRAQTEQTLAALELNKSQTEYLITKSESQKDNAYVDVMPPSPTKQAALPLGLIIGIALLLWGQIL